MPQNCYRQVPMHEQVKPGARVKRVIVPGMPSNQQHREGTVVGAAVKKGKAAWYLPILWDGDRRSEEVHVSRLRWLDQPSAEKEAS